MDYVTERYEEENGEDLSEDPDAVAAKIHEICG